MVIQGTEKIRGSLVINDPKLELGKMQSLKISDDDFNKAGIQSAISMGYLRIIEGPSSAKMKTLAAEEEKMIRCRNTFDKPLAMNIFPREILPNEEFSLTTEQLVEPEVRSAIDSGYVKVLKEHVKESTLNLQNLFNKSQTEAKTRNISLETNEEISTPSETVDTKKKTAMKEAVVWKQTKPPKAPQIPTKEEEPPRRNLKLGADVIDTPTPDPVQADDVPGRRSVIWNPSNNPVPFGKKTNAVVANPVIDKDDISFVDDEQEQQRRDSHPILKNKPVEAESAAEFVDQMQEKQRINEHPVLKNKTLDNSACDIDFV